jgi:hypothetical protein
MPNAFVPSVAVLNGVMLNVDVLNATALDKYLVASLCFFLLSFIPFFGSYENVECATTLSRTTQLIIT